MASDGALFNREGFFADVIGAVNVLEAQAFDEFKRNVVKLIDEPQRAKFDEAVGAVGLKVQIATDESLQKWQDYCEENCFQPPEEIPRTVTKEIQREVDPVDVVQLSELDAELESVRSRILLARREQMEIENECRTLQTSLNAKREKANAVAQAANHLKQNYSLIQELGQASTRLQERIKAETNVSAEDSLMEDANSSKHALAGLLKEAL